MATKPSQEEQATQLLDILRHAVNDYSIARGNQVKGQRLEQLKTKMIDARRALHELLVDALSYTLWDYDPNESLSRLLTISNVFNWRQKYIIRCQALDYEVNKQIKEDDERHKSEDQSTNTESQSSPEEERKEQSTTESDAGDDDWELVEAENLADEEYVEVLRIHALPED